MITKITIMVVLLTTGDEVYLGFENQHACGEGLMRVNDVAEQLHVEVDMAACIPTLAPSTSPRPKPKPEAI